MTEMVLSGLMRGCWRRSYGTVSEAPATERVGNRYAKPTATAPAPYSTPRTPEHGATTRARSFSAAFAGTSSIL
jgi:hypothetical protein